MKQSQHIYCDQNEPIYVGVDVPAGDAKPFFIAVLRSANDGCARLLAIASRETIEETLKYILSHGAHIVAIDAPQLWCFGCEIVNSTFSLHFPRDGWDGAGNCMRPCERELWQRFRIPCFPTTATTFYWFRKLILRGWQLYAEFLKRGYHIATHVPNCIEEASPHRWLLEVYPHATYKLLSAEQLHQKRTVAGRRQRIMILQRYINNIREHFYKRIPTPDENDALAAAITGFLWSRGKCIALGVATKGGCLFVPCNSRRIETRGERLSLSMDSLR